MYIYINIFVIYGFNNALISSERYWGVISSGIDKVSA